MLNETALIDYDNQRRGLPSIPNRKSKDEINDIVYTKNLYWYWEYEDEQIDNNYVIECPICCNVIWNKVKYECYQCNGFMCNNCFEKMQKICRKKNKNLTCPQCRVILEYYNDLDINYSGYTWHNYCTLRRNYRHKFYLFCFVVISMLFIILISRTY